MYSREPCSLAQICILQISNNFQRYEDSIQYTPRVIKDKLFTLAYRRRNILQNLKILVGLLHSGTEIIYFGNCDNVTNEMMKAVYVCRSLRVLSMKSSKSVTKEVFAALIPCVPRLECLTTENCAFVDDEIVKLIVKHCPRLKTLNIKKCNVTNACIKDLGKLKLTALNIMGFKVSDADIDYFIKSKCSETIEEFIVTDCSETSSQDVLRTCSKLHTFVNNGHVGPFQVMMVHKHLCGRYPSSFKKLSTISHH